LCLITSPAAAQELSRPQTAFVVVVQGTASEPAELSQELGSLWARRGRDVIPVPPVAELPRPDLAQLALARRAFAELRPRESIAALEQFLAQVDTLGGGVGRETLLSAWLLLARARLALQDPARADEALDHVLSIAPDIELDEARYPPPLRDALAARRDASGPSVALELELEHAAPNLRVAVDGAPPLPRSALLALAPGVHVLRLSAVGWQPRALRIELSQGHTRVDAALQPDPFAPLRPGARSSSRELRLAASRLGAVPLLLTLRHISRARLRVEIWDASQDLRAALTLPAAHTPRRIAHAAVAALSRVQSEPARRRHRRVVWAVASSAVVVSLAAALTLVLASRPQSGFRLQLEPESGVR